MTKDKEMGDYILKETIGVIIAILAWVGSSILDLNTKVPRFKDSIERIKETQDKVVTMLLEHRDKLGHSDVVRRLDNLEDRRTRTYKK